MAAVNYAESYQKALANSYGYAMYFGKLFTSPNNTIYKVTDAKTIKIPKISTTGRVDGNRDTIGGFTRNADNDWETKTLTNHRTWNTLIHPQDINQTGGVLMIQNITARFNEMQKLPEKQAYLVSKLYADCIAQGITAKTTALTVDNILAYIDTVMETMDEARIPAQGRLLYVTPHYRTMIKQAVQRFYANGESGIDRTVGRVEDLIIEPAVPSDLMKTAYNFTTGFVPGAGAKQINLLFAHPLSIMTPENYSFVGLQEPSTITQGKWAYFEEAFEDVFILNERKGAFAFHTEV